MLTTFKLEPKLLRACLPITDSKSDVAYMAAVHLHCANGYITYEATDGAIMVQIHSKLEQDLVTEAFSIVIPYDVAKNLASNAFIKSMGNNISKGEVEWVKAVLADGHVIVKCINGEYRQKCLDIKFPNLGGVVPTNTTLQGLDFDHIDFKLSHFARLAKSLRQLHAFTGASLNLTRQTGPALLTRRGDWWDWVAVVMPLAPGARPVDVSVYKSAKVSVVIDPPEGEPESKNVSSLVDDEAVEANMAFNDAASVARKTSSESTEHDASAQHA